MGLLSIFKSSRKMVGSSAEEQVLDTQVSSIDCIDPIVIGNVYQGKSLQTLDFNGYYSYYYHVTALSMAINKISNDCAKINIVKKNDDEKEEVTNIFLNQTDTVIKSAVTSFLITGSIFIRVFGSPKEKVIKMQVLDPRVIDFTKNSEHINSPDDDRFMVGDIKYIYDIDRKIFVAQDDLSYIYVIKNENNHTRYGYTPLSNLFVKMDWIIEYEKKHTSNLITGINANKIVGVDSESTTSDDINKWQGKYRNRGGGNSIMWFPGKIGGSIDVGKSETDLETYRKFEGSVYSNFHIPLSLIVTEAQTFNNYETALEQYQEEAVIPNIKTFIEGLNFVMSIADSSFEGFDFKATVESSSIQESRLLRMKIAKESNVLTVNEVRKAGGYPEIEGGDMLDNDNGLL